LKTLILNHPGEFEFIEQEKPSFLKSNEVLLKIHAIGICGTDYHAFGGKQPFFSYPRVLGHELGAEIIEKGKDVEYLEIGDKVSIEPYLNCDNCQACDEGKLNCCENLKVIGVHQDGGMTEYLVLPSQKVHKSDLLNFEQLALVETLAIGCHAVNRAGANEEDLVLVIGAGPIGMAAMQFAKLKGSKVAAIDFNLKRLEFAQNHLSIDVIHQIDSDFSQNDLRDLLGGKLPNVVFDATGNPASMKKAFDLPCSGGKLVFIGLYIGDVTFFDPDFHRRELTVMSSRNALPEDFTYIISKMESGEIDTQAWISHRIKFDDLANQFESLITQRADVTKAIVSFNLPQ
jgi:2-desacetyl-2-hydroxyethyl bacteriochlorophyllide A dehydrogenase